MQKKEPSMQILRVKKHSRVVDISMSAAHTYREIETKNADPRRTHLNERTGAVGRAGVVDALNRRLEGVERASDSVLCLEYLVTASPQFFESASADQVREYFERSRRWLEERHGPANVIATDIQRDEKTPHLVAYVVPRVDVSEGTVRRSVVVGKGPDGQQLREVREVPRKPKSKLSAATFLDGREKVRAMQDDFSERVAAPVGLGRGVVGSKAAHQQVQRWYGELKPNMQSAQMTIAQARQEQETARLESAQSVRDKKRADRVMEEIKAAQIELAQERTRLEQMRDYINQQRDVVTRKLVSVYEKIRRQLIHDEIRSFEQDFRALGVDVTDNKNVRKPASGLEMRRP